MMNVEYNHEKYREDALKAWSTIRRNKIERLKTVNETFDDYIFGLDSRKIAYGIYKQFVPHKEVEKTLKIAF